MPLSPEERVLRARLGAHSLHSKYDGAEITANARAAAPSSDDYWLTEVDPDGELDLAERARRARHAKTAHFLKLAMKSAAARRKNREGAE